MWTLPAPFRPEDPRALFRLATAALAGIAIGLLVLSRAAQSGASKVPELTLYGRTLPLDETAPDVAVRWAEERTRGWFDLVLPEGDVRRSSHAALGIEVDRSRLRQLVERARHAPIATTADDDSSAVAGPGHLVVPTRLDIGRAVPTLLALKEELDQTAEDARLDLDHGGVIPERTGRLLDLDRSLRALRAAALEGAERAELAFAKQPPLRLAAELNDIRHDALLGFFETPTDPAARAEDRTFNLRLAASRLDGYVLLPGQQFDFNLVVGPRDEAHGYRVAQMIAVGELVDGIGGGTCQISGTLHAAALFAGLTIVERHPHTQPSAYIKLGLDAAVVYPTVTLRLKNPYDFPVVLRQTVEHDRVRAEIRGARRPYTVSVVRKIDSAQPFEQQERLDASLPKGMRISRQRGVPGFALHRYRILRDGAHGVREVVIDHYPPTAQLISIGTGRADGASGRPSIAVPPEYLADELLVLSQPTELEAPVVEKRTPGRFGTPGWTREIGAPVWDFGG
jgi:vancomycin resistance protein YoaR